MGLPITASAMVCLNAFHLLSVFLAPAAASQLLHGLLATKVHCLYRSNAVVGTPTAMAAIAPATYVGTVAIAIIVVEDNTSLGSSLLSEVPSAVTNRIAASTPRSGLRLDVLIAGSCHDVGCGA